MPRGIDFSVCFRSPYKCRILALFLPGIHRKHLDFELNLRYSITSSAFFEYAIPFPECGEFFLHTNQPEGGDSVSYRYANAKYMTIAELITRRIRAGEFSGEEQFYSRDELARAYHISPGTARAVLRVLEDRGVIACRRGKRPVPADVMTELNAPPTCRPVLFRDSFTAETPEYDYLAYCVRNLLLRRKIGLREHDSGLPDFEDFAEHSAEDVAIVFPSPLVEGETPERPPVHAEGARIELLIDRTGSNAVSVFTRKAGLDCTLHLLRHNIASVVYVRSGHSAFPWFRHISTPGILQEYIPDCGISSIVFDGELETFPDFLMESVPAFAAPDHAPVAILIDDPYLSDYLSGEIRVGAYSPPSWCSFFGTALNERSMVFPYLDLKLDELAASLLRTASAKAENPVAELACDFHLIQFRNPGPD